MAELRELQHKVESIKALREIVGAMRNLAAIYVRRAEATLRAIRPYADVVETAMRVTLDRVPADRLEPGADAPTMAVVFASDQGLCGTYNDRVARSAVAFVHEASAPVDVVAVGQRGAQLLRLRGVEPVLAMRAPTSLEGIRSQLPDLADHVFQAYATRDAERLVFIYNAYEGMGRFKPSSRRVLPPAREALEAVDPDRFTYEPILTAPPMQLLGHFIEEYFYIELYRGLLEGHASENGARLLSMTAASTNIDKRLIELTQAFQSVRQDVITAELLDVVGGAEALHPVGTR